MTRSLIQTVYETHTDISIFGAVIALMESSLLSAESQRTEFQIIEICKREQARLIRHHDAALEKLKIATILGRPVTKQ